MPDSDENGSGVAAAQVLHDTVSASVAEGAQSSPRKVSNANRQRQYLKQLSEQRRKRVRT